MRHIDKGTVGGETVVLQRDVVDAERDQSSPCREGLYLGHEDRELEIANLRVRISTLQREEQQLVTVLADDSNGADDRSDARKELRKVINEILTHTRAIRKLESERRK